jgi:PAS domain S-box-containing protein
MLNILRGSKGPFVNAAVSLSECLKKDCAMPFKHKERRLQRSSSLRFTCVILSLSFFCLILTIPSVWAGMNKSSRKVLILHSFEPFLPYSITVNQALRTTFIANSTERIDFYSEYLDLARFPDKFYLQQLVDFYQRKYSNNQPDVIIALLKPALDFLLKQGNELFPGVPIVFCTVERRQLEDVMLGTKTTGVLMEIDPKATLDVALRLHPNTKRIVVISGAQANDKGYEATVRRAFSEYEDRFDFLYMSGVPMREILQRVKNLPEHTIVIYVTMFQDGEGKAFVPAVVAKTISETSNRPLYGLFDSYFGNGIVGGRLVSFELQGRKAAELGLRILKGEKPSDISFAASPNAFMFDWRQLKRWHLRENLLPPDSAVLFKVPTLWEIYKLQIIGVAFFLLCQFLLIVFLIIQRLQRRAAEKALLLTQLSLDHASEELLRVDIDGTFLYVNDAICSQLGYSKDEFLSMKIPDINPGFSWPEFIKDMMEHGTKIFETCHQAKDGRNMPVEVRTDLVEFEGKKYIFAFVRDISERKQWEEAVLSEKQRFLTLADHAPFGLALIDKQGNITYVNPKFREIFVHDLDHISTGEEWFRTIFTNDIPKYDTAYNWRKYLNEHNCSEQEPMIFPFTCGNNTEKIISLIAVELETGELIVTFEDITMRKQLEFQLLQSQKMEAIGTLAGGVAHDFNNIMSVVLGYAGLMDMKMKEDDPIKIYVKKILSSVEKAVYLTQSLLAFSRKQVIDLKPVDINEIIGETKGILYRLIGEDIELTARLTSDKLTVLADHGQLDQILMNLATNARDAMPDGGLLHIETKAAVMDEEFIAGHGFGRTGRYAAISVLDTGLGIDEKNQERIFEPFFTTKEVGKGTGLGLSIVYGIIQQHSGFIQVNSKTGQGTTFDIYLPLIDTEEQEGERILQTFTGGTETILIAEDEADLRTLVGAILVNAGYTVFEAIDGEDAVMRFKASRDVIDLVIVDVVMPRMNGKEAYDQIIVLKPEMPVLFFSGYTDDIIHKKGVYDKELSFISKPIIPAELLKKIRQILDDKEN